MLFIKIICVVNLMVLCGSYTIAKDRLYDNIYDNYEDINNKKHIKNYNIDKYMNSRLFNEVSLRHNDKKVDTAKDDVKANRIIRKFRRFWKKTTPATTKTVNSNKNDPFAFKHFDKKFKEKLSKVERCTFMKLKDLNKYEEGTTQTYEKNTKHKRKKNKKFKFNFHNLRKRDDGTNLTVTTKKPNNNTGINKRNELSNQIENILSAVELEEILNEIKSRALNAIGNNTEVKKNKLEKRHANKDTTDIIREEISKAKCNLSKDARTIRKKLKEIYKYIKCNTPLQDFEKKIHLRNIHNGGQVTTQVFNEKISNLVVTDDKFVGNNEKEVSSATISTEEANISTEGVNFNNNSSLTSFEDYVNGYRYYLNFQKAQDDSLFSNHVKYQAHKHHNVDDIGKNILSKIPKSVEVPGEQVTPRSERWLDKYLTTKIDTTPRKFYKSQTISLKSPANDDHYSDTGREYVIEKPVAKQEVKDENDVKVFEDILKVDETETDALEKGLRNQSKYNKVKINNKFNKFFDKIKRKRKPNKRKRDGNTKCTRFCPFKKLRNWIGGRNSAKSLKDDKSRSTVRSSIKQENKDEKIDEMLREIPDISGEGYSIENDDSIQTFNNIDLESFKNSNEDAVASQMMPNKEMTTIKQIVSTFPFIKNAEGRFSAAEKELAPLFQTNKFSYEAVGVLKINPPATNAFQLTTKFVKTNERKDNVHHKGVKTQSNIHKPNLKGAIKTDKTKNYNEPNKENAIKDKEIKQDPFQKAFNIIYNTSNVILKPAKKINFISHVKNQQHPKTQSDIDKFLKDKQVDVKYNEKTFSKDNDLSPVRVTGKNYYYKEINYVTRDKDSNKNLKEDLINYLPDNKENYLDDKFRHVFKRKKMNRGTDRTNINSNLGNITEISFIDLDEIQKEASSTRKHDLIPTKEHVIGNVRKRKRYNRHRKRYFNDKRMTSSNNIFRYVKPLNSNTNDQMNELIRMKRAENSTFLHHKQPEGQAVFVYDLKRLKIPRDEFHDIRTTNANENTRNAQSNESREEENPSRTKRQHNDLKYSVSLKDSDQTNCSSEKEFTVKSVDEIEFIIDLLKNTSGNKFGKEDNKNVDKKTNLQVHISIPETVNSIDMKRELKDVDFIRKIFSAKLSTPVDVLFEVLSYENTVKPLVKTSMTPGLYLLVNNNFTLPRDYSLIELNELFKKANVKKEIAHVTEPINVKNNSEIDININKLLIKLIENLSAMANRTVKKSKEDTKDVKQKLIKEFLEQINKTRNKRNLKKWFQVKPKCHCDGANHTMCCVCAASDAVIREIMADFDSLSSYMSHHCSEIQEYFYKNPSGGRKLKESIHKLDKIINEYYKKTKGCKEKDTCNTCIRRCNNQTKMDFIPSKLVLYIDKLNSRLAKYSTNNPYSPKLNNATDAFFTKLKTCLGDWFEGKDEKTRTKKGCDKEVENVYSVDKLNINIISYNTNRNDIENVSGNKSDYNHIDENAKKESKLLNFIKNLLPKCYDERVTTKNSTGLNSNKEINKRETNEANQLEVPLISDAGGSFWHDYLNRIYAESPIITTEKPLNKMMLDLYNKLNNVSNTKMYEETTKINENLNKTDVILESINNNLEHLIDIIKDSKVIATAGTVAESKTTAGLDATTVTDDKTTNINTEEILFYKELEKLKTSNFELATEGNRDIFNDYNFNKVPNKTNPNLYKDLLLSILKFEKHNIDLEERKLLEASGTQSYTQSANKKVLREVTKKKCHHRFHDLVKTTRPHANATNLRVHPPVLNETPPTTVTTTTVSTTVGDRSANTEACDPSNPNDKCLCDVRTTYDHVLEKSRTMDQHQFEAFARSIHCHKYIPVPNHFVLEDVSETDRRICRNDDYVNYDDDDDAETERTPHEIKFNWIRKKRSLLSSNKFDSYVKGASGIYSKRKREDRKRRTVDLTLVYDGLNNLPDFDLNKDQMYVMQGDPVTITCGHDPSCPNEPDNQADFLWSSSRSDMLKFSNVAIEADELTISNSDVNNGGSYNCSKGSIPCRSVEVTIVTLPEFRLVFLPIYDTGSNCQLKDLLAICANLATEMKSLACESDRFCTLHIEEPVCMKEIGGSKTELRAIAVMTVRTKTKPFHCGAQCKRDIHAGLSLLCVGNLPNLLGVGVIINKHNENRTLSPAIPGEQKWTVTRTLHTKHNDYRRLASHMKHGDIDIVVVCPAGFYLQKKHKLCIACPMNTYSKEGDNACHNCPAGTRTLSPGSQHCMSKLCRHRRYDWFGATWGYSAVIFTMLGFCLLGTIAGLTTQCACAQPTCEKCYSLETGSTNKWSKRKIASLSRVRKRPLSPSKVILTKFFNAPSTMATDSHETKFGLWKEKKSPPALPPVDF